MVFRKSKYDSSEKTKKERESERERAREREREFKREIERERERERVVRYATLKTLLFFSHFMLRFSLF